MPEADEPLVDNVADEGQIKAAGKKEKLRDTVDREDMQKLLDTAWGCRILWKYLQWCGVYEQSYASGNSHGTAFNEGRRTVGLKIMDDILAVSPAALVEMMKARQKSSEKPQK